MKTLLTLIVAGLVLIACKNDGDAAKTVTYYTRVITCDMGGAEPRVFTFEDTDKVYHYFYTGDTKFNIDVYSRNPDIHKEEFYWIGNCFSRQTKKEVIIEPEVSTEEPS